MPFFESNRIDASRSGKVALLFLLYFSQGLPFGFQVTALPVYLRVYGVSLTTIGFVGLLALPWGLKALWAPLVDRFGRRKSWIIPLQFFLSLTVLCASTLSPEDDLHLMLAAVFLMNLFAATQDIAVDGLAVDILGPQDLGPGNAAQVVGYKAGMLASGGLLVWLSSHLGWNGYFTVMAALAILPAIGIGMYREPGLENRRLSGARDIAGIVNRIGRSLASSQSLWLLAFIASYKFGELMNDVMFKPFLVDAGFSPSEIGLWVGTYGMAASLAGSLAGGWLAVRRSLWQALAITATLRIIPLGLEWWLSISHLTTASVIGVTVAEHFFGGMLTTAVFAFMMSRVDRQIGATHYTFLATVEVFGKSPGAWISGPIAEAFGYPAVFAVGTLLSLPPLVLLLKIDRDPRPGHEMDA